MHLEAMLPSISTPVTPNQALHVSVLISPVSHRYADIKTPKKWYVCEFSLGFISDLVV